MTATTPGSWLPQPLRKLAGRALQTALNRALALDPDMQQQLAALAGRSVQLHLRGPELTLAVTVTDGHLLVGPAQADAALRIAATPGSLLALALGRSAGGTAPGKVEIAGDADLARQLDKLVQAFSPDIEAAFAQIFGDVLGVPMAHAMHKATDHVRDSARHFAEDGADWLRDEARLAPAVGEVDDFLDAVDHLRERSERLQARVQRLATRVRGNAA